MKPIRTVRYVALAAAGLALLTGCEKKVAGPPPARPPTQVAIAPVVTRDVPIYLDEIGKCVAPEVVSVLPQVAGRIVEVHFKDGAELKKGDRLFTIDPRPFEAQVDQAKADLALNEASLEQAEAAIKEHQAHLEETQSQLAQSTMRRDLNNIEYERAKNLLESSAISKQEFDTKQMTQTLGEAQVKAAMAAVSVTDAQIHQAHAALTMVKAHIESSKAAVRTSQLNLEYTAINAPIDGRAGQRLVDLGNVVNTQNPPPMVVIERLDPIYADFTVPESELARVRESMAGGQLKVETRIPGHEDKPRIGEVSFIDNAVADGTGTVKLRATMPNPDRFFWPGQFVRVKLLLGTKKDAQLVPAAATQISQTGPFVFVVKPDSTADLRPVQLGQRHGDLIVIDSGVGSGENVVVAGQMMLFPKAPVQVLTDSPAPAPGGKPLAEIPDKTSAKPEDDSKK